jgi:DNA-binding NarL/FixJ family response regulator
MEECIRVLIADDHPMFRKGLRGLLESVAGIEVVGEATDGEEAIALIEHLQPDVILMDINMPGVNGIEATRRILHVNPSIWVLVLIMY